MLTYADLQRIYRAEKASPGLEKVEDTFYADLKDLLGKLGGEHLEYVKRLAVEIFERRRNKIVVHALRSRGSGPANMTPVEEAFYAELSFALQRYRDVVFSGENGSASGDEEVKPKEARVRVRFLANLPSIIGTDMVHYGPFKEGDIVDLPAANAKILVEQEVAEEL